MFNIDKDTYLQQFKLYEKDENKNENIPEINETPIKTKFNRKKIILISIITASILITGGVVGYYFYYMIDNEKIDKININMDKSCTTTDVNNSILTTDTNNSSQVKDKNNSSLDINNSSQNINKNIADTNTSPQFTNYYQNNKENKIDFTKIVSNINELNKIINMIIEKDKKREMELITLQNTISNIQSVIDRFTNKISKLSDIESKIENIKKASNSDEINELKQKLTSIENTIKELKLNNKEIEKLKEIISDTKHTLTQKKKRNGEENYNTKYYSEPSAIPFYYTGYSERVINGEIIPYAFVDNLSRNRSIKVQLKDIINVNGEQYKVTDIKPGSLTVYNIQQKKTITLNRTD